MRILMMVVVCLVGFTFSGLAQVLEPVDPCGHKREHRLGRKVIPYPYLREADVMWARRVWRRIDLRKKLNQSLYFPTEPNQCRKSLYDYLMEGIFVTGEITPYHPGAPTAPDDMFTRPWTQPEWPSYLSMKPWCPNTTNGGKKQGT
ncbi:hypothetical protein KFE98_10035 [bacterium SCSIO 12741]|nr:hypothetical protein KFE98_10035 [bacterium SCSIO 12741]